jgi:hypothetical protein
MVQVVLCTVNIKGGEKMCDDQEFIFNDGAEPEKKKRHIKCPTKTCEDISVSVPVKVCANSEVGEIVLRCAGSEVEKLQNRDKHCSRFIVKQRIHVIIPIDFRAEVEVGDNKIDFELCECKKDED